MENVDYNDIELNFFKTDEENKVAKVIMKYEKPEDLFDLNCVSETPVLSQDELMHIGSLFGLVTAEYKVDLTIRFDDMGSYDEDKLMDIFIRNFAIESKSKTGMNNDRKKLAFWFIGVGAVSFILMFMIRALWNTGSVWSELFFYMFDIITMVVLYQAATILLVENREQRSLTRHLQHRFYAIHFEQNTNDTAA